MGAKCLLTVPYNRRWIQMDVIIFFSLVLFYAISMVIIAIRQYRKDIKEVDQRDKDREKLKDVLFLRLKDYAKLFDIPIYNWRQHKIDPDAAGEIFYSRYKDTEKFIPSSARIVLSDNCYRNPWVLAHELGHYVELLKTGKTTENGADAYGGKICRNLLTAKEEELLSISLGVYFGKIKSKYDQKVA
jgi:hypothetical protein